MIGQLMFIFFFFFNDTATTEIYTLSLHDALPICHFLATVANGDGGEFAHYVAGPAGRWTQVTRFADRVDRKSTRLNSSHLVISYAVFCLKKKKKYNGTEGESAELHEYITRADITY